MAKQVNKAAVDRLKAARAKSLKLMQMDIDGSMNRIAEGKKNDIASVVSGPDVNLLSEAQVGTQQLQQTQNVIPAQRSSFGPTASKLPPAILESFRENPISDDAALMKEVLADSGDLSFLEESMAIQQPVRRQVMNETVQQPQFVPQQVSQQIDYPMIRTIVEEIVRKYAGSITKKVLNESKGANLSTVNTMMLGEKFKFLTDDGDIYECTMRKIGNVKDKKKVNG